MKDELGGKNMTKLAAPWPKVYLYLDDDDDDIDDDDYDICRKAKGTKKCVIEKMFRFHHYKNCIFYHYKNCICEAHNVYVKHIMYTLKKLTRLH